MFRKTIITHALLPILLAAPAQADGWRASPVVGPVIDRLEAQDCAVSSVELSWLRRIVVTCETSSQLREVVLNRTTGALLSDRRFNLRDGSEANPATSGNGSRGNGNGNGNGTESGSGNRDKEGSATTPAGGSGGGSKGRG